MIAAAHDSGFACAETAGSATRCQWSETSTDEDLVDPYAWTIAEEIYIRGGLVITT